MGFFGAFIAVALAGAPPARAIQEWGDQIPNLNAAGGCDGLCHADGLTSSQLYLDFQAAGGIWNAQLASDDSDGDGFSNGWELQNPAGTWVSGTANPGSALLVSNPTLPGDLPPLPVAVVPTPIVHAEAAGQNGSQPFAVKNVGAVPFDYSITPSDAWMVPFSPGLGLPGGEQDDLLLMFATNSLMAGPYPGDLVIAIPGIRADRIPMVPVALTVPEPGAVVAEAGVLLSLGLLARRSAGRLRAART